MQPFFFIHLSVKWGEYLWPFTAELTPIWKRGYKAFKASVMKSIQIEEHRFGVEPEIVAKLARTAVSHQQQCDVARRAAGLPARENRAQLFRHARAAVPALVRLIPPADCIFAHPCVASLGFFGRSGAIGAGLFGPDEVRRQVDHRGDRPKALVEIFVTQLADHMLYPGQGHYRFSRKYGRAFKEIPG